MTPSISSLQATKFSNLNGRKGLIFSLGHVSTPGSRDCGPLHLNFMDREWGEKWVPKAVVFKLWHASTSPGWLVKTDCGVPTSRILIQQVLDGDQEFAFLTSCHVMSMLQLQDPHPEKQYPRGRSQCCYQNGGNGCWASKTKDVYFTKKSQRSNRLGGSGGNQHGALETLFGDALDYSIAAFSFICPISTTISPPILSSCHSGSLPVPLHLCSEVPAWICLVNA